MVWFNDDGWWWDCDDFYMYDMMMGGWYENLNPDITLTLTYIYIYRERERKRDR